MADDKHSLPDISGVFDIDESRIPNKIIERPADTKIPSPSESILLRPENRAQEKQMEKEYKTTVKQKKKQARRTAFKQKAIVAGIAAVLILVAALGIRSLILNRNTPQVTVAPAATETLTTHYDTTGFMLQEDPLNPESPFYAVFVENDYDLAKLKKGQRATITISEDVSISGVVQDIRGEEADSSVITRLKALTTNGSFSAASNITVYISMDDPDYAVENTAVAITVNTDVAPDAVTVPAEAIFKDETGATFVWLLKSGGKKVKRQDVSVGIEADGRVEIKSGLAEGDSVVTAILGENAELFNNAKVTVSAAG